MTATSSSPVIDRGLLGDSGLFLDDTAYVQTIAGMGILPATQKGSQNATLTWSPVQFREMLEAESLSPANRYIEAWRKALGQSNQRIILKAREFTALPPDLTKISQLLKHPSVGTRGVIAEQDLPLAELCWQWPMRIGKLPWESVFSDAEGMHHTWLLRSVTRLLNITREEPRCELLIVRQGIKETLRQLLGLPYQVYCGHILALGPLDIPWQDIRPHVAALLSETHAFGLSLLGLDGPLRLNSVIRDLVEQLARNQPFDLALEQAMPRQSSFHLLDPNFLQTLTFTTLAKDLGDRLNQLPEDATFFLPREAQSAIGLRWRSPRPIADLAAELIKKADKLPLQTGSGNRRRITVGLAQISDAERKAHYESSQEEVPRFLQGNVFRAENDAMQKESGALRVGQRYQFEIFIAPDGEGSMKTNAVFPQDLLEWKRKEKWDLEVIFAESRQWKDPMIGSLTLPRSGTSTKCSFVFVPTQDGPFNASITVHHRGRVLQTARLKGTVAPQNTGPKALAKAQPLQMEMEAVVRKSLGTLGLRRPFDACLVLNGASSNNPSAMVAANKSAYLPALGGLNEALARISQFLSAAGGNSKRHRAGLKAKVNADLLSALAIEGRWLYNKLVIDYIDRSSAAQALRDGEYLQIVSLDADAIIPFEFIYEYPAPPPPSSWSAGSLPKRIPKGVPVCPNADEALKVGRCPSRCVPKESPAKHVCPLGFWGLRKVIERHLHCPDLTQGSTKMEGGEPVSMRQKVMLNGPSLLATSQEVPTTDRRALEKTLAKWKGGVANVKDWKEWPPVVNKRKPIVLVALPHADGRRGNIRLEIGGDYIDSISIDKSYVGGDATHHPIVLLLGCDVAGAADPAAYARHTAAFRRASAALVLGTVATVHGADAANIAGRLVQSLASIVSNSPECFGEVLRQVKREALSDSLVMGLTLIAFGDADWYLQAEAT